MLRIGWLSPLCSASGVGTFTQAVAARFPKEVDGRAIDLTLLHPDHPAPLRPPVRSMVIEPSDTFRSTLELFDLLVYNIGNNVEHHGVILDLLRTHPGIVICHDYVYQHYLASRSLECGQSFSSFAALLMKYGGQGTAGYLARSRITSRCGPVRYAPWDSDACAAQPMGEVLHDLGSALVVHSAFAKAHAEQRFSGPILSLGMPHDQKAGRTDTFAAWSQAVGRRTSLNLVSFGHIQPTKCIDLVLDALASSAALRATLRYTVAGFVGDETYFRFLSRMVADAGLSDIVRFELGVSEGRLAEIMAAADLFINLRKPNTEGSSASLTEQLESGRPVVVLASGCYAEIPDEAAVKLPAEAGSAEVRNALERFVARPDLFAAVGRAGRAYARRWTCANYGLSLVRFALAHEGLLSRRAEVVGSSGSGAGSGGACADPGWTENLAQARAALHYLDRNILALDPGLLCRLSGDDLNAYVAEVVFGIFNDCRLQRALSRYFAGRDETFIYWACTRFALLVEAVIGNDGKACERLQSAGACHDVEFWDVLACLPPTPFVAAATMLLLGRRPTSAELAMASGGDAGDRSANMQALAEILGQVRDDSGAAKLKRNLERPPEYDLDSELPLIDRTLELSTGSADFCRHVDLSGFFAQERDHAWTRGVRGFIGLNLHPDMNRVAVLVCNVNATVGHPATVRLTSGTAYAEIEAGENRVYELEFDVPPFLARSDGATWLQLSTTKIGSPEGHDDQRTLGVCLYGLKVMRRQPARSPVPLA